MLSDISTKEMPVGVGVVEIVGIVEDVEDVEDF